MKQYLRLTLLLTLVGLWACSSSDEGTPESADGRSGGGDNAQSLGPTELPLSVLVQRADNRFTQGDLTGARNMLFQELKLNPDSFDALYRLGVLDLLQDSIYVHERLDRAFELKPDHPGPLFFKGMVYRIAERPDLGREYLLKSYDLYWKRFEFNKDALPPHVHAFVDSFVARRLGPAYKGFRDAAQADSSSAPLWYWYARSALDFKRPKAALEAVDRAKRLDPQSPTITALQAVVQYRAGHEYMARELAEEALTLDRYNPLARHVEGHILLDSGEYREGLIALWRAMLLEPNESSFIDYVGNYMHTYAGGPLGFKFIHLAVQTRGFLAEEHDWAGYTLK